MIDIDEMIKNIGQKHVYIQMHNFPDPDAIASAYGLQYLLAGKGMKSTIVYKGRVDHGSSNAMVQRLNIHIMEFNDIREKMTEDVEIFLVDSQKGNANIIDMPGDEVVCFDHHPTFETVEYKYSDIRPEVGACASIIAEYIFKYHIELDINVATALLYGIKIDTANLTRGVSQLDLDVFYKLFNKADKQILAELDNSVLSHQDLKAYVSAINSIKTVDRTTYANIGRNCAEPLIASVSDFIMTLDTTDNTVVYSIRDDGIKISVRSTGKIDAGNITNAALKGIGSGGGHEHMAGGFVPYAAGLTKPYDDNKYIQHMINNIEERFEQEIRNEIQKIKN